MQSKIEGKFYPLQHEEWIKACKELSPAAKDVLYYIRTSDPYSNGVELTAAAIARDLDCNRSTVSRAFKELDAKGYVDMEILVAKLRVTGKGLLESAELQHTKDVANLQHGCNSAEAVAKKQHGRQKNNTLGNSATTRA